MSLSSLTCYALLSATETDLRELLAATCDELEATTVFGAETIEKANLRRLKERSGSTTNQLSGILPYVDFAECHAALMRIKSRLPHDLLVGLSELHDDFERVVAVRNRVAHSRPLEIDDLPTVVDFIIKLSHIPGHQWESIREIHKRLEANPGYVLALTPDLITDNETIVSNNLPPADHDETGFFGRKKQRREILKALRGPWPVITILGDGGIGKTALALQVAYDVTASSDFGFDAVVWTSARNAALTTNEIVRVEGAIQSSLGLFAGAAKELGAPNPSENPIEEVLEYLTSFKILLILDNIETVIDDAIRQFLKELPNGSKVLITSRIGTGLENPFKLGSLSTAEGIQLLRTLVRARGVSALETISDIAAGDIVTKTKCHPGYIKWLVAGVQSGRSPEQLVSENGLLLQYCMSNVFQHLGPDAKSILRCMIAIPGSHSLASLAFLTEMQASRIQAAVVQLNATNFISQVGGQTGDTSLELADFAKAYLRTEYPVKSDERQRIGSRYRRLLSIGDSLKTAHKRDPYDPNTIDIRTNGDFSAARLLREALESAKANDHDTALRLCQEAGDLAPGYHEPSRVEGYVHELALSYAEAFNAYENAVEIAQENELVRYFFGIFLVRSKFDPVRGLLELQNAARLKPDSFTVRLAVAEGQAAIRNYEEAINICANLLSTTGGTEFARSAIAILIDAGLEQGKELREHSHWGELTEVIESVVTAVEAVKVEELSEYLLDLCLRFEEWARDAKLATPDDYVARSASQLYARLRERRRQADPEHLSRRLGIVRSLVDDKGYGFIESDRSEFFLHASQLWDRKFFEELQPGCVVAFTPGAIEPRKGGLPRARNVNWLA